MAKQEPRSPLPPDGELLIKDSKSDLEDRHRQSPINSSLLNNMNGQSSSTFISPFLKP